MDTNLLTQMRAAPQNRRPVPMQCQMIGALTVLMGLWGAQAHAQEARAATEQPKAPESSTQNSASGAPDARAAVKGVKPVRVLVQTYDSAERELTVVLRGAAEASRKVSIKAQTSGLVVSKPRRKGERIAAGQTLCQIETAERPARLLEAKARLAQAKADAAATEKLVGGGFSSDTKLAADRAALASAEAAVAAIELDIARLEIKAPFAGLLELDAAETGALLQPGSVCAELIAIDPVRFVGHATEAQVGALNIGSEATVRLLDGRRIKAQLTFIAQSADAATRTFRVEASAANAANREGGQIRDGMSAELTLPIGSARGHLVPSSAVTLNAEGRLGMRVVAVDNGVTIARFKPVKLLSDAPNGLWVAGLSPRETVIIRGQEYVRDGAVIAPVTEADLERARLQAVGDAAATSEK